MRIVNAQRCRTVGTRGERDNTISHINQYPMICEYRVIMSTELL